MQYLKNAPTGIMVKTREKKLTLPTTLNRYLGRLLLREKTTLKGRLDAIKSLTGIKRNPPIYINASLCLIATHNLKNCETVLINSHTVLKVEACDPRTTRLIFDDLSELIVKRNVSVIEKRISQARFLREKWN